MQPCKLHAARRCALQKVLGKIFVHANLRRPGKFASADHRTNGWFSDRLEVTSLVRARLATLIDPEDPELHVKSMGKFRQDILTTAPIQAQDTRPCSNKGLSSVVFARSCWTFLCKPRHACMHEGSCLVAATSVCLGRPRFGRASASMRQCLEGLAVTGDPTALCRS